MRRRGLQRDEDVSGRSRDQIARPGVGGGPPGPRTTTRIGRRNGAGPSDRANGAVETSRLDDYPVPTLRLDASGTVIRWNTAAAALLGNDLAGRHVTTVLGRDVITVPGTDHVQRFTAVPPVPHSLAVGRPGDAAPAVGRRLIGYAASSLGNGEFGGSIVVVVPESDVAGDRSATAPPVEPWLELAGRARPIEDAASCAMVGVIGLDAINAAFSRSTGDAVLTEIHQRLTALAGPDGIVDRTAGERFAVIVPAERAHDRWGDELVAAVRSPIDTPLGRTAVGAAVGLAVGNPRSGLVLLDAADRHLEVALKLGPGSVSDAGDGGVALRRGGATDDARLAAPLVEAVAAGEITVHFQPVVDLATGHVVELEALARWRHGDHDLTAAQFLSAARRTGVLVDLGRDVIERALSASSTTRISVNVTDREFLDRSFLSLVERLASDPDLVPGQLQFELAAAVDPDGIEALAVQVAAIRALGPRVVLDGVGGTAPDLALLRLLPIDGVKLDPTITAALDGDDEHADRFARAVLGLLRSLDLDVVAKGVEDDRHHTALLRAGCRLAQGYHYAPPMPADQLDELLSGGPLGVAADADAVHDLLNAETLVPHWELGGRISPRRRTVVRPPTPRSRTRTRSTVRRPTASARPAASPRQPPPAHRG